MKREHDGLGNCNIGQHAIAKALGFLKSSSFFGMGPTAGRKEPVRCDEYKDVTDTIMYTDI